MEVHSEMGGPYIVKMGRCSYLPSSFLDESVKAAHLIAEAAGDQDIWISLSGGIDSEFVARVFLKAGIPFKAATIVYDNNVNEYDNKYCRDFCKKYNIDLSEFNLNIEQFFDSDMFDYAFDLKSISPQFPTHAYLWDQLDGFIVAGHGDPIFLKRDGIWKYQIQEKEDTVYRYLQNRKRDGATGFYAYTPELLLSFILEKEVSNMFISPQYYNIIKVKYKVYEKYFPDMVTREKKTGFETVDELDKKYRNVLKDALPFNNRVFLQPINEFIKSLWPC